MSGLVKAKEYDHKDSNVGNIGSELDKEVRKEAAATEEAWKDAGKKIGLQIWRIEDFKVVAWPKSKYGQFHKGDSYIILRTYKETDSEELLYDLHFWIGQESTQDEMGTAAYKTVELDDLLDDKPVQYREVEGFESELFKECFDGITVMDGGVASGFNHVETNSDLPQSCIFELCGETDKDIQYSQVTKANWSSLHSYSAFVIIIGRHVIKFLGSNSNKNEKYGLAIFLNKFKSDHPRLEEIGCIDGDDELNRKVALYQKKKEKEQKQEEDGDDDDEDDDDDDDDDDDEDLMEILVSFFGEPPENYDVKRNKEPDQVNKKRVVPCEEGFEKKLICVDHDKRTGKTNMEVVASGEEVSNYKCDEKHSYILDKGKVVIGYAGKKVEKNNRNKQMIYCNTYLSDKVNKNAPLSLEKSLKKFDDKLKA